jgi:hypothetical protein
VLVPCVSLREIPAIPRTNFRDGMTTVQKIAAARADIADLEDYLIRADALLRACATAQEEPKP